MFVYYRACIAIDPWSIDGDDDKKKETRLCVFCQLTQWGPWEALQGNWPSALMISRRWDQAKIYDPKAHLSGPINKEFKMWANTDRERKCKIKSCPTGRIHNVVEHIAHTPSCANSQWNFWMETHLANVNHWPHIKNFQDVHSTPLTSPPAPNKLSTQCEVPWTSCTTMGTLFAISGQKSTVNYTHTHTVHTLQTKPNNPQARKLFNL